MGAKVKKNTGNLAITDLIGVIKQDLYSYSREFWGLKFGFSVI